MSIESEILMEYVVNQTCLSRDRDIQWRVKIGDMLSNYDHMLLAVAPFLQDVSQCSVSSC